MPEPDATESREAAQRKSELVATVSHELRTPLASVLGFVELLLDRELDEDTASATCIPFTSKRNVSRR